MAEANQFMVSVAKIDAGMAILITPSFHIIEFPSVLLPENVKAGSIVDMSVRHNREEEASREKEFDDIQNEIYEAYGQNLPSAPVLRVRNVTQTSIVLEWDALQLGTSRLKSLCLYKNNIRALKITNLLSTQHAKLSGLSLDTDYDFTLVLDTTAGRFSSKHLQVKTLRMIDLTGIQVCVGNMVPEEMQALQKCIERIHAKPIQTSVQIDTTHFICSSVGGREYDRAKTANIPVLGVDYLLKCESEGRLVNVSGFYIENRSGGSSANISRLNVANVQTPPVQNTEAQTVNQASTTQPAEENKPVAEQSKEEPPKEQFEAPVNGHAEKQPNEQKEQGEAGELQAKNETSASSKEPTSSSNPLNSAEQSVDVSSDIIPPSNTNNKAQNTEPSNSKAEIEGSDKDELNETSGHESEQPKQEGITQNDMEPIQEGNESNVTTDNEVQSQSADEHANNDSTDKEELAEPSPKVSEEKATEENVNNKTQLKDEVKPSDAEEVDEPKSVNDANQEDTAENNENRSSDKETEDENQVNEDENPSTEKKESADLTEPEAKADSDDFENVNLG
ncbi:chs five like protein Cfr1 [Schizosaccharomyces octosporus yFS286]|uniref:Chs five like protein Cfr1 n=1 Tax=Schizosaccharomyces octosporus (strain yFS286) TaxID=483514 RepID=S9PW05_SCHOY|nr:chs five like protein Cfr1 [Schizosaccharomyces octosporus yFS286]EPX72172.1 chs five like protein Cfr1 [Schizosaccharomyces octosporus yFS286]